MLLATSDSFSDFELIDTGQGQRLEKWGRRLLIRPDPQVIWPKSNPALWQKADAVFISGAGRDKGTWQMQGEAFSSWQITFPLSLPSPAPPTGRASRGEEEKERIKFLLKLSPFKHTGIFPEQAAQWEWMAEKLKIKDKRLKILNLFAYTGAATAVLAKAGCQVTHVDASKPSLAWAKENQKLNNLPTNSVRWILDDCGKFVKRELKRKQRYDAILMDPPAFGHSPWGKTWKFNQDLPGLLGDCVQLLSQDAKFLLINGYATNSSALALNNLLENAIKNRPGKIEFGELCLKQKNGRLISTGIFARWQATA